jgi:hypothetical protein
MNNIEDWSNIADDFKEGLVLGNGASIAFYQGFAYRSLLEEARRNQAIKQEVQSIFDHLHTENFERVLRMLWHTTRINRALNITDKKTRKAYASVRTALVQAVTTIHPTHTAIRNRLPLAAKFMKRFKMIVSLNYDFLVYWTMMQGNKDRGHRLKDCFTKNGEFDSNWRRYLEPHGKNSRSTLVFYPHGNLALASDLNGREIKQTASSSNLLTTVTSNWKFKKYTPLFVSEGTSKQKVATISRSDYLWTVHDSILPELGKRVAIFGWSLSSEDTHILRALCRGDLTDLAVSVSKCTPKVKLQAKCDEIKRRIEDASKGKKVKVVFYKANSPGCWVNT